MLNSKALLLATLLLATQAIASRISYSTGYTTGGVNGHGGNEQKAGGTIPDNQDDLVLHNMGNWSHNRFQAHRNARSHVIIVSSVHRVKTKGEAASANNAAQQLVNQHVH
ncbi:hypothetical protein SI65_02324 [Aspergillus cristatus]|uniref:Secreted protein n=1 Tax=Aspergillus cristatus TaxID=573508 RepID=A0A1E3BKI4_ASPCR|nr:hypothetical protein SI65_02324 [Aspergillus cristatus]